MIVDGRLAPANLSDLAVGEELLAGVVGWTLADGNYGSPGWPSSCRGKEGGCCPHPRATPLAAAAAAVLADWQAPLGRDGHRPVDQPLYLKRVWARDAWHLWSRWLRRLLSHPMAVLPCQRAVLGSLRFADLLTS
jgi:hypothetical protein